MTTGENLSTVCANDLDEIIRLVDIVKDGLSAKRVTLEEKMIISYFQDLSVQAQAAKKALEKHGSESRFCEVLADLSELVIESKASLEELIKMIDYNLNFLEQYFEHEYHESLLYEKRFTQRMSKILESVK